MLNPINETNKSVIPVSSYICRPRLSFVPICAAAFCLCHASLLGWYLYHLLMSMLCFISPRPCRLYSPFTSSLHPFVAPPDRPPPTPPTSYVSDTKDSFRKCQSASMRGWFEWNLRRSSSGLLSPEDTNIMNTRVKPFTDSLHFTSLELRLVTMFLYL